MNTKANRLEEVSTTELLNKKKKIAGAAIGLGIVSLIAVIVLCYLAITKKNYVLLTLLGGIFIPFLPIFISLKQVDQEIKLRNVQ